MQRIGGNWYGRYPKPPDRNVTFPNIGSVLIFTAKLAIDAITESSGRHSPTMRHEI